MLAMQAIRHSTPADYDNSNCVLHPQNSARNPLIVRVDIHERPCGYMQITRVVVCGKVKFPVSCTVHLTNISHPALMHYT